MEKKETRRWKVRKKLVMKIMDIHYNIINPEPRKSTATDIEKLNCCTWKIKNEIRKFNKIFRNLKPKEKMFKRKSNTPHINLEAPFYLMRYVISLVNKKCNSKKWDPRTNINVYQCSLHVYKILSLKEKKKDVNPHK